MAVLEYAKDMVKEQWLMDPRNTLASGLMISAMEPVRCNILPIQEIRLCRISLELGVTMNARVMVSCAMPMEVFMMANGAEI